MNSNQPLSRWLEHYPDYTIDSLWYLAVILLREKGATKVFLVDGIMGKLALVLWRRTNKVETRANKLFLYLVEMVMLYVAKAMHR